VGFEPTTPGLKARNPSDGGTPTPCLKSSGSSDGDQCRRTARIVNQDVLVRKGLRAMPSRLRRSESRPPSVHWELLMQVPKAAGDSQHLVDCCHSCSRECGRLLPDR
jgi:hypothetical protein